MSLQLLRKIDEAAPALAFAISPSEMLTLFSLAFRANTSNLAWPSVETITARTGLSERTVQNSLRTLEDWNLIEAAGDRKGGRPGSTTVYRVREDIVSRLAWARKRLLDFGMSADGRNSCARFFSTGAKKNRHVCSDCTPTGADSAGTGAIVTPESVQENSQGIGKRESAGRATDYYE